MDIKSLTRKSPKGTTINYTRVDLDDRGFGVEQHFDELRITHGRLGFHLTRDQCARIWRIIKDFAEYGSIGE